MQLGRALRLNALRQEVDAYAVTHERAESLERAHAALRTGALTPFLGAGASADLGFPCWDDLIDGLLVAVFDPGIAGLADLPARARKLGQTSPTLARFLEAALRFPSALRPILRQRLYESYDEGGAAAFAEPFCQAMLGGPHRCAEVITYNFDNAIERALRRMGLDHAVAYSHASYASSSLPRICHPHGYLPHPEDEDPVGAGDNQVFSEREYNRQYSDPNHWANIVQGHAVTARRCLFLGLSMTDPDLRQHLDQSCARAGVELRHFTIQKDRGDRLLNYLFELDCRSLGVEVVWVKAYADIPRLVTEIAR
jgi:hypothetical protein